MWDEFLIITIKKITAAVLAAAFNNMPSLQPLHVREVNMRPPDVAKEFISI